MPRFIPRRSATLVNDYKESRMKSVDPTKPYRKFEGMGPPPPICCSFAESIKPCSQLL